MRRCCGHRCCHHLSHHLQGQQGKSSSHTLITMAVMPLNHASQRLVPLSHKEVRLQDWWRRASHWTYHPDCILIRSPGLGLAKTELVLSDTSLPPQLQFAAHATACAFVPSAIRASQQTAAASRALQACHCNESTVTRAAKRASRVLSYLGMCSWCAALAASSSLGPLVACWAM